MTSYDSYTLLPWVLIDPELLTEDSGRTALPAVARHIKRFCSVMMGELDLQHLSEQAVMEGRHSARILLEAIRDTPIVTAGLSIDDPESLTFSKKALGAILAEARRVTDSKRLPIRDWAHFGSDAYLRSEERETIEQRHSRPYESFSRERIWLEVLEPFTRTRTLNIYDRYLFKHVFAHDDRLAHPSRTKRSGLAWFFDRLVERSEDGPPMSVAVRSESLAQSLEGRRRLRDVAQDFVDNWFPTIDIRLDFCTSRPPHDRFMFAHTPLGNIRVLEQSNSLLEKVDVPSHRGRDALRLTLKTNDSDSRVAVRDWQRAGEAIELSVTSS